MSFMDFLHPQMGGLFPCMVTDDKVGFGILESHKSLTMTLLCMDIAI